MCFCYSCHYSLTGDSNVPESETVILSLLYRLTTGTVLVLAGFGTSGTSTGMEHGPKPSLAVDWAAFDLLKCSRVSMSFRFNSSHCSPITKDFMCDAALIWYIHYEIPLVWSVQLCLDMYRVGFLAKLSWTKGCPHLSIAIINYVTYEWKVYLVI